MPKSNGNSFRPLPFKLLRNGSHFRIFAEPSRRLGPQDITDTTTYKKRGQAFSETLDGKKSIILALDDLVIPLTSGHQPKPKSNVVPFRRPAKTATKTIRGSVALPKKETR